MTAHSILVGTTPEGNSHTGIMFLVEVALGKEHHITRDDSSLVKAPAGFDCVIAKVCVVLCGHDGTQHIDSSS